MATKPRPKAELIIKSVGVEHGVLNITVTSGDARVFIMSEAPQFCSALHELHTQNGEFMAFISPAFDADEVMAYLLKAFEEKGGN
jgi:hypothetical protein